MSEARKIFKNTVALTIATGIERASSILLAFFISHTLYAAGLGIYSATIAFYGLITMAADMGASNFLVHEIAKDQTKFNLYITHLGVMGIVSGVGITVLLSVVVPYFGYSDDMARSVHIMLLAAIPGVLNLLLSAVLVAYQRVEFRTYTTGIAAIFSLGVNLYLLTHGRGVISLVVVFVIEKWIVTLCYFFFIYYRVVALRWEFQLSFMFTLLREIKVFAASSILGGFFARPEILILSFVRNETQVGYYSAAVRLIDVWNLLADTYMTNVFPILSRSYHLADRKAQVIQDKSIKYCLAISLPLAVGLTVVAQPIVFLLYGPNFESTTVVLFIVAWNLPLSSLYSIFWRILVARGQQNLNVRTQLITTFSRLISGYVLISMMGYLGAAITTVANLFFHDALLSFYIKQDNTQLHIVRTGGRFVLAALVMGGLTLLFLPHLPLWGLIPLAAVTYLLLLILLGAFSPDEREFLRQLWLSGALRKNV